MEQTFYIESDEEIISVIGRLRKSSSEENIFVFPKRALVLQSIVNLRLFQREAQKLGKKIVIVSQDEMGKALAEKAGIKTEQYSEDFSQKAAHLELVPREQTKAPQEVSPVSHYAPKSEAIGSNDFYTGETTLPPLSTNTQAPVETSPEKTTLRIRNASPEKLTSLNSKRFEGIVSPHKEAQGRPSGYAPQKTSPLPSAASLTAMTQGSTTPAGFNRNERLKNFYNTARPPKSQPTDTQALPGTVPITGKKAHLIFSILGGISLLSLIGAALFLLLPTAEVHVTPYKITKTADVELSGHTDSANESSTLLVRTIEKEEVVSFTTPTTGVSGGTNQKARGTVVIYNNYSGDPQPLVATTRLETPDGKLFRLISGVTVPGMTNTGGSKSPGAIEAQVIADQPGAEYNIDASTFTIPGFKGGPKYEKFSAQSTKAMVGGGSGGESDIAAVAQVDLDAAEREAKEKAKENFLNEVRDTLAPDEKVLEEHLDIVAPTPAALPQVGTVANAFDYRNTFKVRAFIFSEKPIREKVENTVEKVVAGIAFKPVASSITYNDSIPDFANNTVRIQAHALVTLESDIDQAALKTSLLGKDEDGIRTVLDRFPAVKKINVVFHPQLFVRSIPDSEKRVSLLIEPGEAEE